MNYLRNPWEERESGGILEREREEIGEFDGGVLSEVRECETEAMTRLEKIVVSTRCKARGM